MQIKKRKTHPVRALLLLTQPTVLVLVAVVVSVQWRIPTLIRANILLESTEIASLETRLIPLLESGQIHTFIVKQGEIRYPDFPDRDIVVLPSPVKIELKPLTRFRVENVVKNPERQEIQCQFSGIAEHFRTESHDGLQDLRLTQFDKLIHSRKTMFLGIALWVVFTVIGWVKLYQELKT